MNNIDPEQLQKLKALGGELHSQARERKVLIAQQERESLERWNREKEEALDRLST